MDRAEDIQETFVLERNSMDPNTVLVDWVVQDSDVFKP